MDEAGDGSDGGGGSGVDAAAAAKAADDAAAAAAKTKTGPTDEEARLLKENMKRKEELRKSGEEKAALEAKLKLFEGIDPEAVKKLLLDQSTSETKALEAKGDWERLKGRMAEEHAREVGTVKQQLQALQDELGKAASTINDLSIGSKFSQSKFIADEMTLTSGKARVIYGEHFDLVDGEVVGYDKPRGVASRTAIVDQYGNAVAFEVAMRKIVESDPEKDHMIKSKMKPGAGSGSTKPSGQQVTKSQTDGVSSIGKIAAGLSSLKINSDK